MWDRRAEYLENHDGDTVKMMLDQGFDQEYRADVRLLGTFAPELDDAGGPETRDFVTDWFKKRITTKTRWNFIVITARMKVADHEQRTLARYVGTVTSLDGTDNLNLAVMQFVISKGYSGGIGAKL